MYTIIKPYTRKRASKGKSTTLTYPTPSLFKFKMEWPKINLYINCFLVAQ